MSAVHVLVFATISASVVCWAVAEIIRSRGWWAAGAALAVIHSVAAFGAFYEWSHEMAQRLTMEQTRALTGVEFAGGIYVNYLFLAIWIFDAAWWWLLPRNYHNRPLLVTVLLRGFLFFIIFNGAIVFADGWARAIGVGSTLAVIAAWSLKRSSRRGAFSTAG